MKHLPDIATYLFLALSIGNVFGQDANFDGSRSPYATLPPLIPTGRPGIEEIIRPPEASPIEESSRRMTVGSLLDQLLEARGQLDREMSALEPIHRPPTQSASPTIKGIETLLNDSQLRRRGQTERTRQLLNRLDIVLRVESSIPRKIAQSRSINENKPSKDGDTGGTGSGKPHQEDAASVTPVDLTGAAVDRLRLADALFGSGEFELARDIYLQLRDSPLHTPERAWIEFQIASCYRNLGEYRHAERFYRMVVGSKEETALKGYARWWLDAIQNKKDVEKTLGQIRESVIIEGQNHGDDHSGQ
jgi:tetratricopeptide (TPR) repeat protein